VPVAFSEVAPTADELETDGIAGTTSDSNFDSRNKYSWRLASDFSNFSLNGEKKGYKKEFFSRQGGAGRVLPEFFVRLQHCFCQSNVEFIFGNFCHVTDNVPMQRYYIFNVRNDVFDMPMVYFEFNVFGTRFNKWSNCFGTPITNDMMPSTDIMRSTAATPIQDKWYIIRTRRKRLNHLWNI